MIYLKRGLITFLLLINILVEGLLFQYLIINLLAPTAYLASFLLPSRTRWRLLILLGFVIITDRVVALSNIARIGVLVLSNGTLDFICALGI